MHSDTNGRDSTGPVRQWCCPPAPARLSDTFLLSSALVMPPVAGYIETNKMLYPSSVFHQTTIIDEAFFTPPLSAGKQGSLRPRRTDRLVALARLALARSHPDDDAAFRASNC